MGSKTLFNAVFIRPEQVVHFWLCTGDEKTEENDKRPIISFYFIFYQISKSYRRRVPAGKLSFFYRKLNVVQKYLEKFITFFYFLPIKIATEI